jgi:Family of unknown function (DUF6022)
MVSLQTNSDIHAIVAYIHQHIDSEWQAVFEQTHAEMAARYDEIGDSVYAIYGTALFKPIHAHLKEVGIRTKPRIPFGGFSNSREWGEDETNRERWFVSKVIDKDGNSIGSIAIGVYHDHEQLRIPRPLRVIALHATGKAAVVSELSQHVPAFADALEARIEYATYYADSNESTGNGMSLG